MRSPIGKSLFAVAFAALLVIAPQAKAASLSNFQVQSVLNLLQAFGIQSASMLSAVGNALQHASSNSAVQESAAAGLSSQGQGQGQSTAPGQLSQFDLPLTASPTTSCTTGWENITDGTGKAIGSVCHTKGPPSCPPGLAKRGGECIPPGHISSIACTLDQHIHYVNGVEQGCAPNTSADEQCIFQVAPGNKLSGNPGCNQTIVPAASTASPTISVNETASANGTVTITWSTQNAPQDSAVFIYLATGDNNDKVLLTGKQPTSGSYTWKPQQICATDGDECESVLTSGTYSILAQLYTPKNACYGQVCPSSQRGTPTVIASAQTSSFTAVMTSAGGAAGGTSSTSGTSGSTPTGGSTGAGLVINILWDSSVANAPPEFKTGIMNAVSFLQSHYTVPLTVTINVGYGEEMGNVLGGGVLGQSQFYVNSFAYSTVYNALKTHATTANETAAVSTLPASDPYAPNNGYWISTDNAQALGVSSSAQQGWIGLSSTYPFSNYDASGNVSGGTFDFQGTALHELTEVLGRFISRNVGLSGPMYPNVLNLYAYTAPGARMPAASGSGYFSFDNGNTYIHGYSGCNGDCGDWNSEANDSFNASSGQVYNPFSVGDQQLIDVLGYKLSSNIQQPPSITFSASPTSITAGQSATLSWSSTNATSCTGTGFSASNTSGSVVVSPTVSTSYILSCTGAGGSTSKTITLAVNVVSVGNIGNASFETPAVGSYVYNPTGATWAFTGGAGIEANGSAWNAAGAPDGIQAAFIQASGNAGTISQAVSITNSGSYALAFQSAMRPGYPQYPFTVTVDGSTVGSFTPSSTSFSQFTTSSFTLSSGVHTIAFVGSASSVDESDFIDMVILTNGTGTPPSASTTASLAANPTSITAGQSSTLSWSSTNATSCTGSNFTASGISGSTAVTPAQTTTYGVTCTGTGGSATQSATVNVSTPTPAQPTASLSANPTSVTAGQSSTLSWSSTNATNCSGNNFSASGVSGSVAVAPTQTTTYIINCTGAGGSVSSSATVTVSNPQPVFGIGSSVQTNSNLNVRNKANTNSGKIQCTQPTGSVGTITGGPSGAQGYTWWNVNFQTGCDGWVVQDYLNLL